ncbi:hypothetical protein AVDCRST_MAG94-7154 [uncultured Leptolyngbya sp.]|uniref:Uncharacterized protein n=1 Tax=uncultured Leptolyngbya sp. TaxID=332963 RepID=A0A6J4PRU9_9CYAN|nr:hypothetical protein AVDCRST_MAG94-7154 [uncultured Leptolyngbya sp.]
MTQKEARLCSCGSVFAAPADSQVWLATGVLALTAWVGYWHDAASSGSHGSG